MLQLPKAQVAAIHEIGLPRTAVRGLKNIRDYIQASAMAVTVAFLIFSEQADQLGPWRASGPLSPNSTDKNVNLNVLKRCNDKL